MISCRHLLLLFILHVSGVVCAQVVTNEDLYAELQSWEEALRDRQGSKTTRQIESRMQKGSLWEMPVLQGEGWSYTWGYLACLTHAWAKEWSGKPIEAYQSLVRAGGLKPVSPPPEHAYYYWRWHLSMGETLAQLLRFQDAEWYLREVRSNLTTNDGFYLKATASLAMVLNQVGRLDEAYQLFDELIRLRPDQPPEVWGDYIRLLFDYGFFEEGVEAILQGAERHGISPRHRENDFFAMAARQYWLFFREDQVVRWYALLGHMLDTTALTRGTEDYLAVIVNSRSLMKKVYPVLLHEDRNDIGALRERLEKGQAGVGGLPLSSRPSTSEDAFADDAGGHHVKPVAPVMIPAASVDASVEKAIHHALFRQRSAKNEGRGEVDAWRKILEAYSSNDLQRVTIDGVNGWFVACAGLGGGLAYNGKEAEALPWLMDAVESIGKGYNQLRVGDALLMITEVYVSSSARNADKARRYLDWARQVAVGNRRLQARVHDSQAGLELLQDGPTDRRIPLLQRVVDHYGCIPRRNVYERLARDYYRTGRYAEGFRTFYEGMRRCRLKMEPGYYDHMVDGLVMNRSLHSASELRTMKNAFRAGALRFTATIDQAPAIARMLDMSEAPWIDQHLELAELEESGGFLSDTGWSVITNALHAHPSFRAARLYTDAAVVRSATAKQPVDWGGWLEAWRLIDIEAASGKPEAPTDSGGRIASQWLLLEQWEEYARYCDVSDYDRMCREVPNRVGDLSIEQFDWLVSFLKPRVDESVVYGFHLARMRAWSNTSVEHPSFAYLFAMYDRVDSPLRMELADLLRTKRAEARLPRLQQQWDMVIERYAAKSP